MNTEVILTCAVTGGSDIKNKHPVLPVTPREIALAAVDLSIIVIPLILLPWIC
ncbi:3-keto-5-aminohexanoate cleavage protein [Desulfobacula sp.]